MLVARPKPDEERNAPPGSRGGRRGRPAQARPKVDPGTLESQARRRMIVGKVGVSGAQIGEPGIMRRGRELPLPCGRVGFVQGHGPGQHVVGKIAGEVESRAGLRDARAGNLFRN